jgi:hypothetical protein
MAEKINEPGAPVNTPQHLVGQTNAQEGTPSGQTGSRASTQQTGPRTAPREVDVADPHPADEGHPYDARHPGGTNPPTKDLGPNPGIHNGTPARRPHNAGSGAE